MTEATTVELRRIPITHPDAARLVEEVQGEYVVRYGSRDESPVDPTEFADPTGAFFVAYADGVPVATGAWRRRSDLTALGTTAVAEIKRMYVVASSRRTGLARRMLAHLEETALADGVETMVLETGSRQPEAIALYVASGYERIADFGYHCGAPEVRSFARRLKTGT